MSVNMSYVTCPPSRPSEELDPCRPEPPFWWLGSNADHNSRDQDSSDYYTSTKFEDVEKKDVLGEMKLDDPDEYTPGEIHQSQKPHPRFRTSSQSIQGIQWTPKSPEFYKIFDVNSVPQAENYLYNMVKKRQQLDLASALREDSDYSLKDGSDLARCLRPVQTESPKPHPSLPGSDSGHCRSPTQPEHFFCECHQYHSHAPNNPVSKPTVCNKCGCKYVNVDLSKLDTSRRIMAATSAHVAGTNPYCFRDVIGRN